MESQAASSAAAPGSVHRTFTHHREHPALPRGYDWKTQKKRYSPPKLPGDTFPGPYRLKHPYGSVFCHRGLYERSSGALDNSQSAILNGIRQGLFCQEVDAFAPQKLDEAFIAHDAVARRVTKLPMEWERYPITEILKTVLVTRGVDTKDFAPSSRNQPDFASTYLETPDLVPGLLNTLWGERNRPTGLTLQIDLREEDLAKAMAFYSYHVSKRRTQYRNVQGVQHTAAWMLFESAMLKGYNQQFNSFGDLQKAVEKSLGEVYKMGATKSSNFRLEHLHVLPPLIMVFSAGPLRKLAEKAHPPGTQMTYDLLYATVWKQVKSFVRIDTGNGRSYSFILEIGHSGLGLGYDRDTQMARNPLNGATLRDPDVIAESCLDRVMIDVSLELREKYPELLFASCTRLPDVITSHGRFKAWFKTSKLVRWYDGEKGLSNELRAIHGGLYPQSHIAIADNPLAEIAARTWIDEELKLDRSDLLRVPYREWLESAGKEDAVKAIDHLNSEFLPNKYGGPVDHTSAKAGDGSSSSAESHARTLDWVMQMLEKQGQWQSPEVITSVQSPEQTEEEAGHDAHDASISEYGGTQPPAGAASEPVVVLVAGKRYTFTTPASARNAVAGLAAYKAAEEGNEVALQRYISDGYNVNTHSGLFGTALGAACAKGHTAIAELLLHYGADIYAEADLYEEHARASLYPEHMKTPLEHAASNGHTRIVEMLLRRWGQNTKSGGVLWRRFNFAFIDACRGGHSDIAQLFLERGVDVNFVGFWERTALGGACAHGDINLVKVLLGKGANVNPPRGLSRSPLMGACESGHLDIAELLLSKGAHVNHTWDSEKLEPQIIQMLQNAGAIIGVQARQDYPSRSGSSLVLKQKRRNRVSWGGMSKRNILTKELNAPPLRPPRRLRSCGDECLVCRIDQATQAPLSRDGRASVSNPVETTLRTLKTLSIVPEGDKLFPKDGSV